MANSKFLPPRYVRIEFGTVRGIYEDTAPDGSNAGKRLLVFDVDELLEFFGWANTPENAEKILLLITKASREVFGASTPVIRDFRHDGRQN
jgi:hypothetical protein